MTKQERDTILSKDILSLEDVQKLTGLDYQQSARIIRDIKAGFGDRIKWRGYIATSDYKSYMGIE